MNACDFKMVLTYNLYTCTLCQGASYTIYSASLEFYTSNQLDRSNIRWLYVVWLSFINTMINLYHIYKSIAEWLLHMEQDIATYNQAD